MEKVENPGEHLFLARGIATYLGMADKKKAGAGGGEATTRFKIGNRLPERKRAAIVNETARRAAECYSFSATKTPQLKECLRELMDGWDDALDRGEWSGDDAMPWRENQLAEARKVIDHTVEHLQEVAQAANAGQWLPDDVDVLGVQTDIPMLIDTLHDLWANWATMRIGCSKEPMVPLSWPRLTEPVEESEDDDGADARPLR